MTQPKYPGAHPLLQGRWAFFLGLEREPPAWDPSHKDPEFRQMWLRGYDAEKLNSEKRTHFLDTAERMKR